MGQIDNVGQEEKKKLSGYHSLYFSWIETLQGVIVNVHGKTTVYNISFPNTKLAPKNANGLDR